MSRPPVFLTRLILPLTAMLMLGGCIATGNVDKPIPTAFYPAPQTAQRLVVMLPGRGDSLAGLQRHRVAQSIQHQWPHADVILAGLTMPYYLQGHAAQRLHDEVIAPAMAHGDKRTLWLAGISLGGMGALLYDRAYPDQAHGMLLLSPYLGDKPIYRKIRDAGGLRRWQPGPPQPMRRDTYQHELWRSIRRWRHDRQRSCTVWVAYGASERFRKPIELMTPLLPARHVLMLPGQHNWTLWTPALKDLLQRVHSAPDCRSMHAVAPASEPSGSAQ